jgi:hypothetical protein
MKRTGRRRTPVLGAGLAAAVWILAAGAAVAPEEPVQITVPPALAQQNASIEPSGVAWAAALERYLVVSDDTGTEDEKHQPEVFAMTRDGAFDAAPVPILGISELNDPEAICAGPGGTFFLTTSHSANKKGHTKPARRLLLQLKLEGRGLRVVGQADLTTAQDGKGGGLLAIAGVDPGGKLDIEALTYRKDVLLVGLKAPLTSGGAAVILRLAAPAQALRAGRIGSGALTRFREVSLCASRPEGAIPQGIADLLSLPDGSLVLCANSPKGMTPDGGGAIYWLKPGASSPVLLHDFPGLKPEGVTLADDGKGLVVVFDNDLRPPLWIRWPLPKQ